MTLDTPSHLTAAQVSRAITDLRRFTSPRPYARASRSPYTVSNLERFAGLWWHDVVVGYGLAEQRTDRRPTGKLAVRFYVLRKLPKSRLKASYRIPRSVRVTTTSGESVDVPTDVIEMRRLPAAQRTIVAGDSMGHFIGVRGTFGLAVKDAAGQTYALTCAHVAAPRFIDNLANAAVESPADDDRVAGPNVMGNLFTWTELDDTSLNRADAALVKPTTGIRLSNASLGLSTPPRFSTVTPAQFAAMKRRAAIVQTQRGAVSAVIDSIANDLAFDFDGRLFRFTDIASYVASVEPGDSGSAVVDAVSRDVLGLHFAGQRADRLGFCILASTIVRSFPQLGLLTAAP